ncbi:MAG: exodeoxyribonuclease VII large subunit [Muribaculaceae bacterium]|nr:exodeoxyribonuclease VII large subunit [Muribaculaceae bacterium]
MEHREAMTLTEVSRRLSDAVTGAGINDVWITAETSDLRSSGGHCYMELIQKHPDTGATLARVRANIWASRYATLNRRFMHTTGSPLASGIRVMLCVTASYHPVYGMSLTVDDIDAEYTLGDLLRRRREIIRRLTEEGVIDMNRQLEWPVPAQRIAVVSADGAAGYGDFMHQLYLNGRRLRFHTELFPAVLQGEKAPSSIIEALDRIAMRSDEFDGVVIIRGGGATSDLASFDDYDLAANVAQFPLPVIVGVGHERDVTVLDYVANMRVKTPTAAAEWLIGQAMEQIQLLGQLGSELYRLVSGRISGDARQLAYIEGQLAPLARAAHERARQRLDGIAGQIPQLAANILDRSRQQLDSLGRLLDILSPQSTLRRGYTITRSGGRTLTSVKQLASGQRLTTSFADGEAEYMIINLSIK